MLLDTGDTVLIEEPHYQGARLVFLAAGAQLRTVPVDMEGMATTALPDVRVRARLVYVTPSHQVCSGLKQQKPTF